MTRVLSSAACGNPAGHGRPTVPILLRKRRHHPTRQFSRHLGVPIATEDRAISAARHRLSGNVVA
jgi:hypothetical protein